MPIYAIRHKETGKLMPIGKRNRGYAYWMKEKELLEPDAACSFDVNGRVLFEGEDDNTIRCFSSLKKAQRVVNSWAKEIWRELNGYDFYGALHLHHKKVCNASDPNKLEVIELEFNGNTFNAKNL